MCVFPGHFLLRDDLHVTPHLLGKSYPFSFQQIIKWAFVAPPDDVADELQRMGHQAAVEWAKTGGIEEGREIDLAEAVEPDKSVGTSFVRSGHVVGLSTSNGGSNTNNNDMCEEKEQHAHGDTKKKGNCEALNKVTDNKNN